MSRASVTLRAQAAAEAGMTDTCTITRLATSTTNPDTALVVRTYTTVYSGACRFQQRGTTSSADVGEAQVYQTAMELQLPMSVTTVQVEDVVTCNTSGDAALAGRTFWVKGLFHKTNASARRLPLEEVTS